MLTASPHLYPTHSSSSSSGSFSYPDGHRRFFLAPPFQQPLLLLQKWLLPRILRQPIQGFYERCLRWISDDYSQRLSVRRLQTHLCFSLSRSGNVISTSPQFSKFRNAKDFKILLYERFHLLQIYLLFVVERMNF